MPEIKLKVEELILDHENPRITRAEGQQEAIQKIVKDQKTKLVKLAQSIAEHGLNPMDRLLVLKVDSKPVRYIALEGNRRVAALKLLAKPAIMSGLDIPPPMKKAFERLAQDFVKKQVEPISCFELESRQEGDYWLELRHKGENQGRGIVDWTSTASQRFRTRSPATQALDLVTERGGLSADILSKVADKFPITTLQRFVEDREVRKALGIDVKKGKLVTTLPPQEVLKPLRRIVRDLATKERRVGSLMKTEQMLDYVKGFEKKDAPDLSKASDTDRVIDEIPVVEFKTITPRATRRRPDPSDRKTVVPRGCNLNVTKNRLAEIYKELRTIELIDAPNAIAVLLRVFLELSVDHFLETHGGTLKFPRRGGGEGWKPLDKKLAETVDILVNMGVSRTNFAAVTKSITQKSSPMHTDLLHQYVHDQYTTPLPKELMGAWDHAQPLFEKIWP